ncbi:OmpP1/FadL family transporter [Chromobacterium paludis]|uniref:Transporter n=1 Tax=Chromobacterium paludis TaxID=2605945 RepID=A0A5C1DFT3_9NEIS|nr:OmpP1/FadL family transporter [Chromobacterium paludis]QEL55645.1 transporter [Chromobacterium paludis]
MRKRSCALLAAMAASGIGQSAWASGYQFDVQSVRAQGSANASSAEAADPSTIFYNPAGLTWLSGTQLTLGATAVDPHSHFSSRAGNTADGLAIAPADAGGSYAKQAAIPHGYLSHQINDKLTLGLGLFVPYGAKISYDDNFIGRYYGNHVDFKSLNINPSLGFRLSDRQSVGLGLSAQYLDMELGKNQDLASLAYGLCQSSGNGAATCQAGAAAYTGLPDARVRVTGSNWSYGFNAGYLFANEDGTHIGLAYRSRIRQTLHGDARFTLPDALPGGAASPVNAGLCTALADGKASIDVTTPESLSLSLFRPMTPRWSLMGDLSWIRHDHLQDVEIDMPTALLPDRKIVYQTAWRNSWRASLGADFLLNSRWTLRAGYMYDQSPTTGANYALTVLPDANRQMYSLGASYRLTARDTVDLAYSYLKLQEAPVNRTDDDYLANNGTPGTLTGQYHTHVNLLGLGLTHRF